MTVYEGQGHRNWYQSVQLSGPYHHTKFKVNSLTTIVCICVHHSAKGTMPMSAYVDSDFENLRCPSDVLDSKQTNTDGSL